MGRRLFVWLLIGATLGTALLSAWRHPNLRAHAHEATVHLLSGVLGTKLRYELITTQAWPPAVTIHNLQLAGNATWPTLAIRTLHIEPALWPSSSGKPMLRRILLTGLRLQGGSLQSEDLPSKGQQPKSWPDLAEMAAPIEQAKYLPRLPFDVLAIEVEDGQILWEQGQARYHIAQLRCQLQTIQPQQRTFSCQLPDNSWTPLSLSPTATSATIPFTAKLALQLQGSFDSAMLLSQADVSMAMPGAQGQGQLYLAAQAAAPVSMALMLSLEPPRYAMLTPLPKPIPAVGSLFALAQLSYRQQAPSLHLISVFEPGATRQPEDLPAFSCQLTWRKQQIQLQQWRFLLANRQQMALTGSLRLADSLPLQLQLQSSALDLTALLAIFGVSDFPMELQLQGEIALTGTIAPLKLLGPSQLELRQCLVPSTGQGAAILQLASGMLLGQLELSEQGLLLKEAHVTVGNTTIDGDGFFPWSYQSPMRLTLSSQRLYLADLQRPLQLDLAGFGPAEVLLEGPYHQLQLTGHVALDELAISGQRLGKLQSDVFYNPNRFALEQLNIQQDQAQLQGALQINACPVGTRCLAAALDSYRFPLQALLRILPLNQPELRAWNGLLTGRMLLEGPIAQPTGQLQLKVAQLSFGSELLGDVEIDGLATLDERQPYAEQLLVHSKQWRQGAQWQLQWQRTFAQTALLEVELKELPATLLALVLPESKLTGQLAGHWRSEGLWPNMRGKGVLRGQAVAYQQWQLGNPISQIELSDTNLRGETSLRGLGVVANWQVDLTPGWHWQLDAQCNRSHSQALLSAPSALDFIVSGQVHLQGPLAEPSQWQGQMALQEATLSYLYVPITLSKPTTLRLQAGRLLMPPSSFANKELAMGLSGSLALSGQMQLDWQAKGDLAAIRSWLPGVLQAKGPFQFNLLANGTLSEPTLQGQGTIEGASVRLEHSDAALEQLFVTLQLQERTLLLQQAKATLGKGHLEMSGDVIWPIGTTTPQFNLRSKVQQLPLRPLPDCDAIVTGDLLLLGSPQELMLSGALHLDEVHYTARIAIEKLLRQRKAPPLRVPSTQQAIGLNVRVFGNDNIFLSSNVLNTELQVQLQVTGKTDRIGLVGIVRPLWGRAIYRDNTFVLQRGSIDFLDPFQLRSNYQFVVTTKERNCDIQAEVQINGTTDSYTIVTNGSDSRGAISTTDVLSCLQFGIRSNTNRDVNPGVAGSSSLSNLSNLTSGVGALWAMSGLDERINRLLPFRLQELRLTSGYSPISQRYGLRLVVGKDITPNLRARINSSLDSQNDVIINLEYKLRPNALLQSTLQPKLYYQYDLGLDMRLQWDMR